MADAKKCDRCGRYYQKQSEQDMSSLEYLANSILDALRPKYKIQTAVETLIDLCPCCSESFRRWVNGKEGEKGDGEVAD